MSERAKYILDVDTGIDDSAAIAYAVGSPEVDLLAVTTVAGNVDITQTTQNTQRVLAWLGADHVPVHRGASRPLTRPHVDAAFVHGTNGLGGANLPATSATVGADRGPAAIVRLAAKHPGEITLVCVGPLTNLAIALNVEPTLTSTIKRLVIMGGAFFNRGNITPHAEFNVYVDPEAADQVFSAPFADVTVIGLDASHQTALTRSEWQAAGTNPAPAAQLLHQVYDRSFTERGLSDCYLHDPLAFAIAVDSSLAEYETGSISVVLEGEERGRTVLTAGSAGARVAKKIDTVRFAAEFAARLGL